MKKKVTLEVNFSVKNLQLLKKLHDRQYSLVEEDCLIPESAILVNEVDNLRELIQIGLVTPVGSYYKLTDIGTIVAHRKV